MPEEKEQSPNEGQKQSSLDQETLDAMLAESQGDADQLESMLNSLEDRSDADAETETAAEEGADLSELTDDMEAMLERMESDEPETDADAETEDEDTDVSDLNDMLYQATLADTGQTESGEADAVADLDDALESLDDGEEDAADALLAEADDTDDEADEALDTLLDEAENDDADTEALDAMLEDVEDEVPADVAELDDDVLDAMLEESDADSGADDLDAMLEEAEETTDDDVEDVDLDATLENVEEDVSKDVGVEDTSFEDASVEDLEDMDLDAMLEDVEEETDAPEGEAESDVDALLEDVEDDASDETDLESLDDTDLDAMLEDVEDVTVEDSEASEEDADLDALLEDVEDEASEEMDLESLDDTDLDAMLEDVEDVTEEDSEVSEDGATEEADTDLDALLEDVEEDVLEEDSVDDADTDLDALLEDVEDDASEEADVEDMDLDAMLEDTAEEEADADLDALLEDVEDDAADESDTDLDALLEDVEEDASEEMDLESLDDTDLDAMLEDVEDVTEEDSAVSEEDADLDALLEDVEEDVSEDADLDALLENDDASEAMADDDLDALLDDDLDVMADEDVETDDDLDDLLASASDESTDDILETTDDLDDLLEDMDADATPVDDLDSLLDDTTIEDGLDDELDDLLEDFDAEDEPLNVGVEDEVAQILATGESGGGSDDILDEFKSVQESIITPGLSDNGGTLLMIDGDPDQRTLFEDALGGQYDFAEANTLDEGLQTLHNEHVDLILLSLDDDEGGALEFVEQVNASLDMPSIPIIVTSEHTDRIEKALRLGAVDYVTRPLDVMDIEFQVPQKVANQMKLQKADRILAGGGASVYESDEVSDFDLADDDLELDDLLDDDDDLLDSDAAPEDLLVRPASKKDPLVPLSDQQKILRNRQAARRDASKLPLFALIAAFLITTVGAVYHYAEDIQKLLSMDDKTVTQAPPRPQQPLPKVKMPEVPKQNYASSSMPTPPPARGNVFQRQADVLKSRIRQNVQELADNGGAWWSPWRVMRASGASVSGLVDGQSAQDILDAFGVDMGAVERGLSSQRTLDYLAGVGFDLRGKDAADLSAREAFELLSARQIKNADQIVDVLSKLTDGLAADRTAQEEHKEKERRKRKGQAMMSSPPDLRFGKSQMVETVVLGFDGQVNLMAQNDEGGGHLTKTTWLMRQQV